VPFIAEEYIVRDVAAPTTSSRGGEAPVADAGFFK